MLISLERISTVASFMEELISPSYYSLLTLPFGYVISVKDGKVRVLKAPPFRSRDILHLCENREGHSAFYSEHYETVEMLKESLFLDEEGMLWGWEIRGFRLLGKGVKEHLSKAFLNTLERKKPRISCTSGEEKSPRGLGGCI